MVWSKFREGTMGDCCSSDHGVAVSLMHRLQADGQERLVFVDQRCLRVVFPGFKGGPSSTASIHMNTADEFHFFIPVMPQS